MLKNLFKEDVLLAKCKKTTALHGIVWGLLSKVMLFAPVSGIVGSYFGFFSLSNMATPLIAVLSNSAGALGFFSFLGLARVVVFGFSLVQCANFIPGLLASLSFVPKYRFLQLVVPVVSMVLFIAHPVGKGAWLYTLYWLIPIAIYFTNNKIYTQSLAATFVAHAAGSVFFLYARPMTSAVWLALIPVVAYERLVLALGTALIYTLAIQLKKAYTNVDMKSFFVKTAG